MDERNLQMREYLGDGVYAGFDGYQIVLWTDRPEPEGRHWIAVEEPVIMALLQYRKRLYEALTVTEVVDGKDHA